MDLRDILFHNFSQITPPAFGLDLSDLSLKIAYLKKHGKEIYLESFGRREIPEGIIKEGKIIKKEELAKIIKSALKEVRGKTLKTKYAICSFPELHAFVQVVQLPKMKLFEAKEAIKWEAEANIPMSIDEAYIDWQIVKPVVNHLEHLDVLISAAPKVLVDNYVEALKLAGLKPLVLEVESMAAARSLIKDGVSHKPVLIIDLGATRTSFIIFSGHAVRFTTSISVSNRQMVSEIAKNLKITKEQAWNLKKEVGLNGAQGDNKVLNVLLPTLNNLVEEIEKYIVFHREHAAPHEHGSAGEISKIILCGGGANLKGLSRFLFSRLNIAISRGNPWVNILKPPTKKIPQLPGKESLAHTTVLGLALRGVKS